MTNRWMSLVLVGMLMGTTPGFAFEAHEWLIAVQDAGSVQEQRVYLPRFVRTRRPRAIGDGPPPPHGGVLLEGAPPKMLDVMVKLPNKTPIAASWPEAKTRDGQISWTALAPTNQNLRPANNWWTALRGENAGVGRDGTFDNFLFFDPTLDLKAFYTLMFKANTLTLSAVGQADAPQALIALSRNDDQWASASGKLMETMEPAGKVTLQQAMAPLTSKLPPRLQNHLAAIVKHALKGRDHAVLVQLPEAAIESEVLPLPEKRTRTYLGLYVWQEERSMEDWNKLVKQLGHADWTMRETASAALAEAGEAALPALTRALASKSLEAKVRAERLILRLGNNPDKLAKDNAKSDKKRDEK